MFEANNAEPPIWSNGQWIYMISFLVLGTADVECFTFLSSPPYHLARNDNSMFIFYPPGTESHVERM
jgi:hypothetical protein